MKKGLCFILALMMVTPSSLAITTKDKLNQTKDNIKKTQTQLNENKAEQKDLLSQINDLDISIDTTENQIEKMEENIKDLEKSIVISEENIAIAEEQYEEKDELKRKRLTAYYKNGNVSLKSLLGGVSDPAEKLYMEKVADNILAYDKALMEQIEQDKEALEKQKESLEEDNKRCKDLKDDLEVKLAGLNDTKEIRTQYMAKLESDAKALQKSVDEMNAEADRLAKELAAEAAKNQSSTKYTGGKMTWPLPGAYIITSKFGNRLHPVLKTYSLHTGVDIAGSGCNGKPVVAAAAGTVIKATFSKAYGNYIIIDHGIDPDSGKRLTTLYAHSSKLEVKAGDKVTAGQEIMKVGTTGYSTGPHLHFEVRLDGAYQNPLNKWISVK